MGEVVVASALFKKKASGGRHLRVALDSNSDVLLSSLGQT